MKPTALLLQRRAWFWLLLATVGLLVPWWFNIEYFMSGGSILPQVFWRDAMSNPLSTAITLDVYWSALVFSCWVLNEGHGRRRWGFVALCFGVGLSFALPLYLAWRSARNGPDKGQNGPARS